MEMIHKCFEGNTTQDEKPSYHKKKFWKKLKINNERACGSSLQEMEIIHRDVMVIITNTHT